MKQPKNKNDNNHLTKKVTKSIKSGAKPQSPANINYKNFIIEAKYTNKKSFKITKDMLDKLWYQSLSLNKNPLLIIGIKKDNKEIYLLTCNVVIEKI